MKTIQKISPYLWFDHQAEEAAHFYAAIFPGSSIDSISRYGEAGKEFHGKAPGSVLAVGFTLAGCSFTALNGGPQFKFSEAISLLVHCETQAEIDHYWSRLGADGSEQPCGWLKDRYGLSWQIVPVQLTAMISDPDPAKSGRVMQALMQMKKLDIAAFERAYAG